MTSTNSHLQVQDRPPLVVGEQRFELGQRSYIMGVLNVTPDSFSDGGRFNRVQDAIQGGLQMAQAGADIIDVGGESTRPGAPELAVELELQRVIPVIQGLREAGLRAISIDTRKAAVAKAAVEVGAAMINDVSGGHFDPQMWSQVAKAQVPYVIMHSRSVPQDMQQGEIVYQDVVAEVTQWLRDSVAGALQHGVGRDKILVDPGIGFGKTLIHNIDLTRGLAAIAELGFPILFGPSRKRFIGALLGGAAPDQRLEGTLASLAVAVAEGADVVRVHDVVETKKFLTVLDALLRRPAIAENPLHDEVGASRLKTN